MAISRAAIVFSFLLVAIVWGTLTDMPIENPRLTLGGYRVLAADFHIHTFPLSWGVLAPWDTVNEARHDALDVIAITPHNHTWVSKVGQWFSRRSGDPMVIVGEEIHAVGYHVLAIGITQTIAWRQPAGAALDDVHRQGGFAIAAHPIPSYAAYDADALRKLDGAEVVHPLALRNEAFAAQMREFFGRAQVTAIGDSDYHLGPLSPYLGEMGICRTYVFARERTEKAVLDALRERRTVVYDREHVYGDPAMIELAANDGRLPKMALNPPKRTLNSSLGSIAGILSLFALSLHFCPIRGAIQ
jgi:hypothetical protein